MAYQYHNSWQGGAHVSLGIPSLKHLSITRKFSVLSSKESVARDPEEGAHTSPIWGFSTDTQRATSKNPACSATQCSPS